MSRRDVIIVASVSAIYGLGGPEEYARQCLILERGGGARAAGDPRPAGRAAVRAQRLRLRPQQVPGAGRHHRGVPRLRGARRCGSRSSATRWSASPRSTRSPARWSRSSTGSCCSRPRTTSPPTSTCSGPSRASRSSSRTGSRGSRSRASCSRRSGCGCAPPTTSRCCARSACAPGIENYSRHLDGRAPGETPYTLLDYFPDDFLVVVDESHQTDPAAPRPVRGRPVPQGHAGRARLPAALGDGQPSAALRRVRREGQPGACSSRPRRAPTRSSTPRRSSSRSSGRPA